MKDRMDRVSESIKREISIILQGETNDPRVGNVTISEVRVSNDLKSARVLCVLYGTMSGKKETMRGLKHAAGFVRGELSRRLPMKYTPRLVFVEDTSAEKAESIESIFKKIREDRGETPGDEERTQDGQE
jgi:ribosome-binding factor A